MPICTPDIDAGTLTCEKDFADKLYASEDAGLGDYALTNGVFDSFKVTAIVDSKTGHSETPTAGNMADATLRVTLSPTPATSTLPGVTGKVYAPIDAGEITAAIARSGSECGSRIGSRSIRVCADVSSESEFEREDASIEMTLDSAAWSALKYKESSFTFRKRADSSSPWAAVPNCAADDKVECYSVTPNSDGTAGVIDVKNIASFGQFALARRVAEPNAPPARVGTIPEQIIMIGSNSTLDVGEFFRDPDNDRLRYVPTSSDTSVVTASVSGNTVVFNMVRPGTTTMTVIAIDPTGGTAFQSFAITVQPANVAPEAEGTIQNQVVGAVPLSIDIDSYFSDADGDNLTYTAESDNVEAITVDMTGSMLTMTWVAAGESTVTIVGTDRFDETATQTASVRANTPPEAVGSIQTQAMRAGGASQEVDVSDYFADADGDELAYTIESDNAGRCGGRPAFGPERSDHKPAHPRRGHDHDYRNRPVRPLRHAGPVSGGGGHSSQPYGNAGPHGDAGTNSHAGTNGHPGANGHHRRQRPRPRLMRAAGSRYGWWPS